MKEGRKQITVWAWDYRTNELLSETGLAYPDERDPKNILMPARTTTDEPPKAKKGYKIVRDTEKDKWVSVKK